MIDSTHLFFDRQAQLNSKYVFDDASRNARQSHPGCTVPHMFGSANRRTHMQEMPQTLLLRLHRHRFRSLRRRVLPTLQVLSVTAMLCTYVVTIL